MICVGIGQASHDCNVSAYIDGEVKYAKFERESNIKQAQAPRNWVWYKLKEWGIPHIDFLVETDQGTFRRSHDIPRMPHDGQNFLKRTGPYEQYMIDHHLAHSLSNFDSPILCQHIVLDGMGSGDTKGLFISKEKSLRVLAPSFGGIYLNLYRGTTDFKSNAIDGAGKVMGLVPYGEPDTKIVNSLSSLDLNQYEDMLYDYLNEKQAIRNKTTSKEWWDVLSTVHHSCYEMIEKHFFSNLNKQIPVGFSGGCALNVDWNRSLIDAGYDLRVEPSPEDGGLSLGALRLACHFAGFNLERPDNFPYMQSDEKPEDIPSDVTIKKVAESLANGEIVGWYQGNGELGPRALGNRSILMRPDLEHGKDTLNQKVKHREWWRPFGASVKRDKASEYFDLEDSPYMLYTAKVLNNSLPSITHVDGTCRHQTVTPEMNEPYYRLLHEFEKLTGLPVLLNTSLNLGGRPIAGSIQNAMEVLETTDMDKLCVGDQIYA